MTADNLFGDETVGVADSPRLIWKRQNKVRVHFAAHMCGPEDEPYCVWLPGNDAYPLLRQGDNYDGVPNRPDECGYGQTEDDALVDLAKKHGLKIWNEL